MGVPAAGLAQTVAAYAEAVELGVDEACGKPADMLTAPVAVPPFYAATVKLFVHNTCGGLKVDDTCAVRGCDGLPIEGLYAGGDAIAGLSLTGLCRAVVTGYIAGQAMVARA